ncbi:MAG: monovalent cation:proton antiporter-2 (CPA2) family protein [Gammaproteobacteria bacterium]
MISSYLLDIIILLIAAVVIVPFAQAMRLGAVPGFLIAGMIVGPYGLGLIHNIFQIANLAEIGVVFLLFVIGIELKPSRLWQMRRMVFGLGLMQILVTSFIIGTLVYFLVDIPINTAVLIGPALALSSTAFVLQILVEKKLLTSTYGRVSLAILLMQDLAVVPLLALIPLLALPDMHLGGDIGLALTNSLFILTLVVIVGRYLLHPILHRVALSANPEIFTASAVLIVLGTAIATEHAGFSMAMGAFLAGMLISDSSYKHQIMAEVQPFRGLLLGLFFISMGMSLNLNLLIENPVPPISMVCLLMVLKAAVLFPLVLSFKFNPRQSLAVSLLLAQSGEFALVLFSLANQSEILPDALFQQLLIVVLLSMLLTPILAHWAHRLIQAHSKTQHDEESPEVAPIVIAGFGRIGRRIGEILTMANKPYVALDSNASVVEESRKKGYPVFYGDASKPEILKAAGASDAQIIIVSLNDMEAAEKLVSALRGAYPDKSIYVRGHSLEQCRQLRKLGASDVVSENVEASLELARMALSTAVVNEKEQETIIGDFRRKYRARLDETND